MSLVEDLKNGGGDAQMVQIDQAVKLGKALAARLSPRLL